MANRRDRNTDGGGQSGTGVGADDRDRHGQRVQDPESPWATGLPPAKDQSTTPPGPGNANHGHQPDTRDRISKGEDENNRPTRSGSRSNAR